MRTNPQQHELQDVITLLFALRESLSLRDRDLQHEIMSRLTTEMRKLDPALFARIEEERLAERDQMLQTIHREVQARRTHQ